MVLLTALESKKHKEVKFLPQSNVFWGSCETLCRTSNSFQFMYFSNAIRCNHAPSPPHSLPPFCTLRQAKKPLASHFTEISEKCQWYTLGRSFFYLTGANKPIVAGWLLPIIATLGLRISEPNGESTDLRVLKCLPSLTCVLNCYCAWHFRNSDPFAKRKTAALDAFRIFGIDSAVPSQQPFGAEGEHGLGEWALT